MQSTGALVVLLVAAAPCLSTSAINKRFLSIADSKMQPEVVARSLVKMENEWRTEAGLFAECSEATGSGAEGCMRAQQAFQKSCGTVVSAVQHASSGDRAVVAEYMGDICGQPELQGWHKESCQSLASAIAGAMTADAFENRENFKVDGLCHGYWSQFAKVEAARIEQEHVTHEAEMKKLEEERAEAAKKKAEEEKKHAEEEMKRAEAEKKAAEEKAAEEKRRQSEEETAKSQKAAEEAAIEQAAAARKVEEAAAQLKAQEEEAARKAEEAKKAMEQAKAAAEEARSKRLLITDAKSNSTAASTESVTVKKADSSSPKAEAAPVAKSAVTNTAEVKNN